MDLQEFVLAEITHYTVFIYHITYQLYHAHLGTGGHTYTEDKTFARCLVISLNNKTPSISWA